MNPDIIKQQIKNLESQKLNNTRQIDSLTDANTLLDVQIAAVAAILPPLVTEAAPTV